MTSCFSLSFQLIWVQPSLGNEGWIVRFPKIVTLFGVGPRTFGLSRGLGLISGTWLLVFCTVFPTTVFEARIEGDMCVCRLSGKEGLGRDTTLLEIAAHFCVV